MTINWFGKSSDGRKKKTSKKQPQPQSLPAPTYQASQTTLNVPSSNYSTISSPPPPAPANPGWRGNPGPYFYQQPSYPQGSQYHLPPPSAPIPASNPGTYLDVYASSSTNLAASYPPPQESRWKSSLNLAKRPVHKASQSFSNLQNTASASVSNLQDTLNVRSAAVLNQGAALCDLMASKFNEVITSIDGERFGGDERELVVQNPYEASLLYPESSRGIGANPVYPSSSANNSSNHFSKVWLYANSRFPPHLPPLKVYMPTYPLFCLAAQYSERIYARPTGAEKETHVDANWRHGTKAMVLKSVPIDDMNTVVFAIRGSATFMDWAVNFRSAPTSPQGFLDDEGNLCHAGFLHVARQMIGPVAERLRTLLQENPSRSNCSLLITGHSAGGAVAALLFAHMMSTTISSELNHLTGFFKRVHCITFGAPPISLLPLQKPENKRHKKSLFFSFINEGDPVPRAADRKVLESLIKLYAAAAPSSSLSKLSLPGSSAGASKSTLTLASTTKPPKSKSSHPPSSSRSKSSTSTSISPAWTIPPGALSTAGRLILLRNRPGTAHPGDVSRVENVEAVTVGDEMLRGLVMGDPIMHQMRVYLARVEELAKRAVLVQGF